MKYNEKADKYLEEFYARKRVKTAKEKFHAIRKKLKYAERDMSFHSFPGGDVSWEQKQGALEYEFLEGLGLIELTYV